MCNCSESMISHWLDVTGLLTPKHEKYAMSHSILCLNLKISVNLYTVHYSTGLRDHTRQIATDGGLVYWTCEILADVSTYWLLAEVKRYVSTFTKHYRLVRLPKPRS